MINTTDFTLPTVEQLLELWTNQQKIDFFEGLLNSTNRPGIDKVINFLRTTDFYYAPSSTQYHSNYRGGLMDHSILVYMCCWKMREMLIEIKPELAEKLTEESVIISTLLHDICKTCFYKPVEKFRKNKETNQWETYEGYEIEDTFPFGHGEKSVVMLQNMELQMSIDEMLAIRYHMGSWDGALWTNDVKLAYQQTMGQCPLAHIVQAADTMASQLLEKKVTPPAK